MPKVPTYDQFQATPTVQPNVRVDAPAVQDVAGAQAKQMGQGFIQAGDSGARIALDMQNEANQLRVIDATAAAREKMYDLMYAPQTGLLQQKGWNALQREGDKDLATEYTDKFKDLTAGIADSLGNDQQRRMFAQQTLQLQTQLHGTATQHMGSEYRTYQGGVMDAEMKSQANALALIGSTDPGQVNPGTGRSRVEESAEAIYAAARAKARLAGLPQALADTQALEAVSGAHKMAVDGLIEAGKYEQAGAYRTKYKDQLTAHDLLDVAQKIDNVASLKQGYAAVDKTFVAVSPQMNPSSLDRAFNIAVDTESRGRQFSADGKPLTSPKGAIGVAQVMPDTAPEAAKLAGLPWDEARYKNDPEYNRALGRAYFQKQVQDFDGNVAQAYAAYNAGPGAMRDALSRAAAAAKDMAKSEPALQKRVDSYNAAVQSFNVAPSQDGKAKLEKEAAAIDMEKKRIGALRPDWLANLPDETQAYVRKNVATLGAGGGAPKMPTQEDLQQQVLAQLPADANPKVRRAVEEEVGRRYTLAKQAKEQRDGQAVDDAMTWLRANDYNWSAMPASLQSRVPSDKLDNLMDYASKGAKGIPVQTDLALYQMLSSDDYLRKLTPQQFAETRQKLSDSDFKKFADRRDALTNPSAANGPGELNTQAIGRALEDRLVLIGVDTKPKHTDTEANARLGMVRKMVDDWVLNAQQAAGKKLGDAETAKVIDDLFRQSVTMRSTFMGMSGSLNTQPLLALKKASDVPDDARQAIENQFKARGVTPTDADVVGAYIRGKLSLRGQQNAGRSGATGNF